MSQTRREILLQNRLLKGTNPASRSLVLGGVDNAVIAGAQNAVLGGKDSKITDSDYSTITGGNTNTITGSLESGIVGGIDCSINNAAESTIMASSDTTINGANSKEVVAIGCILSTVGAPGEAWGARRSLVQGYYNTLAATADSYEIVLMANDSSVDDSRYVTVLGGRGNTVTGTNSSVVLAGEFNTVTDSQRSAMISSLGSELTDTYRSAIIGGYGNSINDCVSSAVLAGDGNTNNNDYSVMLGCDNRTSVGQFTTHVENIKAFGATIDFGALPTTPTPYLQPALTPGQLWVSGTSPNKYLRMA